ncbi:MAG TPA: amino acid permease [Solirubrobacterales bacterium]|nr:amino acid permease [Solirubrobacterales bacterium]
MSNGEAGVLGRSAPQVFTRKATGLVREGRTADALFYNVMWSSVALTFAFFWLLYSFYYNGSNAILAALIAALLGLPGAFLYAMLAQTMPRTGGDYVFNSRALHPAIGFAANASYCFWLAVVYGLYTTLFATYGIGAFANMMAGYTGAHGWISFGEWFSTDAGLFITGTAVILISVAVFVLGGLRLFFRLQVGGFVLYMVGAFLLPMLIGLFGSEAGFISNFNEYGANLGVPHAFAAMQRSATEIGFEPSGFSFEATLKSVSVFWFIFGFVYASNYFAGEVRLKKRTHMLSIPGALAIALLVLLILTPLYNHVVGYGINGALGFAEPSSYGFAEYPAYPELMAIASGSPVLGGITILGFSVGLLLWLPQTILLISRSMFAWSFDRIMPQRLSYVEPRSHSPVVAIGIVTVLGIASTAIYAFTDWFSTLSILLGLTFTLVITGIAGIALPFTQKAMVENSPYNRRVAGIPLLSLVGGLSVLGFCGAIAILLWDPGSGTSLAHNPGKLWLAIGVFVVAFAVYFISRQVRRAQGIDIELAHAELPPE